MKYIFPILSVCFIGLSNGLFAQKTDKNLTYKDGHLFTLIGKIQGCDTADYHRVDTAHYDIPSAYIKTLLTHASGMALLFTTNSASIAAEWEVSPAKALTNLNPIANKGLDLYIRHKGKWQYAGSGTPVSLVSSAILAKGLDTSAKECLLYLPLYDELRSISIGIDPNASITTLPNPFRYKILIYGSSILQGAAASRPGLSYPSRLARKSGLYFLNMGLSGSAKMEPFMARIIADIDADAYVLDCVPNASPQQIKERAGNLIAAIRQRHPGRPIIVINTIFRESAYLDAGVNGYVTHQITEMKKQVDSLLAKGYKDLYYIDSKNFLGDDHEGTVDGTHPNDLGFDRMINILYPQLMPILKKYKIE